MIRGLFGVALFVLAIHVAYIFISPPIKNTMLEGKMEEVAKNRVLRTERDVRWLVMEFVDEKKIPLRPEELVVHFGQGQTTIAAHYKVVSRFWFYEREYEFFPASSDDARLTPHRSQQASTGRRGVRAGH